MQITATINAGGLAAAPATGGAEGGRSRMDEGANAFADLLSEHETSAHPEKEPAIDHNETEVLPLQTPRVTPAPILLMGEHAAVGSIMTAPVANEPKVSAPFSSFEGREKPRNTSVMPLPTSGARIVSGTLIVNGVATVDEIRPTQTDDSTAEIAAHPQERSSNTSAITGTIERIFSQSSMPLQAAPVPPRPSATPGEPKVDSAETGETRLAARDLAIRTAQVSRQIEGRLELPATRLVIHAKGEALGDNMTEAGVKRASDGMTATVPVSEAMPLPRGDGDLISVFQPADLPKSTAVQLTDVPRHEHWPGSRNIVRQLEVGLAQTESGGTEIHLNPAELGRVRLSLVGTETSITLQIIAERPETVDLMRRHLDTLAAEFRALGYQSVNFEFGQSPERNRGDGGNYQDRSGSAPEAQAEPDESGRARYTRIDSDSGLTSTAQTTQLDLRM
jgi:hypothetical protein